MDNPLEFSLSLGLGIALAAACGFRVFVPMLVVGLAHRTGHMELLDNFHWLGSNTALICLGGATILETLAYFIPVVDNFLDTIATPAAAVAGTVMTYGMVSDISPWLQWSLALIAGGGTATVVQSSTVALRASSTAFTAGIANPLLGAVETIGAVILSILSILLPALGIVLALSLLVFAFRSGIGLLHSRRARAV
jgi:hypothetical protein